MTVKELMTELSKCDPDDVVKYDFTNSLANASYVTIDGALKRLDMDGTVNKVLIDQSERIVFLSERP